MSVFGWLVALVIVNPLLFRFGDLHNWHGNGMEDRVTHIASLLVACGLAFSIAIAFGAPRWMLWPCLVLSLSVTLLWAAPSVVPMLKSIAHYRQEPEVIRGRFFQLYTYLAGALSVCASAILWSLLCFYLIDAGRPNHTMQLTPSRTAFTFYYDCHSPRYSLPAAAGKA